MMKDIDMCGALFEILLVHARVGPLRLKYFNLEDATPHMYGGLLELGACSPTMIKFPYIFPSTYVMSFFRHASDYTSTPSMFYEFGRRCSYDHLDNYRDPMFVPPLLILVPPLSQRIIFPIELSNPSQLGVEVRVSMAWSMWITLDDSIVGLDRKRCQPPPTRHELELEFMDECVI